MRYAIFSDVHANLEAFEAVLEMLQKQHIDRYLCAGDIVGYGADPVACIQQVRSMRIPTVAGNHDWAAAGIVAADNFNPAAKQAVHWTSKVLDQRDLDYLTNLPLTIYTDDFIAVHATLDNPQLFDYLIDIAASRRSFRVMDRPVSFVGHTHVPQIFVEYPDETVSASDDAQIDLDPSCRYIVNVGSVGQPRDSDPRACACIYDTGTGHISLVRVAYDCEKARSRIIRHGLPHYLGDRLLIGR